MKLLVTGSRTITDTGFIHQTLDQCPFQPDTLVHGNAEGVDQNAMGWAVKNGIDVEAHPVPEWAWDELGAKAGPMRNNYMVSESDAVVAIWDGESSGTRDTIDKAEAAGLPMLKVVVVVDDDGRVEHEVLRRESDGNQMLLSEFED